jgi:hypothetical protein
MSEFTRRDINEVMEAIHDLAAAIAPQYVTHDASGLPRARCEEPPECAEAAR